MRSVALGLAILLAGCSGASPLAPDEPADVAPAPGALEAPTFRPPVRLGWGGTAAEPSVAVAPDGSIVVAAAPQLWVSRDGGRGFEARGEPVCVRVEETCLPGEMTLVVAPVDGFGGDADVAFDSTGTLHHVGLNGESGTLPYQRSADAGATWTPPVDLAMGNRSDRQWIQALAGGALVVTWRDFGAPDDDAAESQLLLRRSLDGGATWEPARAVAPDALQGPLASDPQGALAFAFYDGGIRLARSGDGGATWTLHDVHLETRDTTLREGRPIDVFPVAAFDAAGNAYVVWAADMPEDGALGAKEATSPRVWFASSSDGGVTWSAPRALSPEGKAGALPWIAAGASGRVAVAWYESRLGTPSHLAPDVWDVMLVESIDADVADPTFVGGRANSEPVHVGALCRSGGGCEQECGIDVGECVDTRECPLPSLCVGKDRSRLELFEIALDPDGHPVAAWVADAQPPATGIEIHFGGVATGTPLR